ncbi:MAG: laccase domain-containing protein, partial [Synergistaceae bacterium]|nr:laccase domain-containing protein [Synergistaceae bacterium]
MPLREPEGRRTFPGFDLVMNEGDCRLDCVMPEPLAGCLAAALFCRGPLLDGTEGVPSRIYSRIGGILKGDCLVMPWQVHGTAIMEGRAMWAMPQRVKADGVHLDFSFDKAWRTTASIRFADCAPILLASSAPRPWAMILHSGFKGTLFDIFGTAWERASRFYRSAGGVNPRLTYAWVGPAIGPCCFTRHLTEELA